MLPFLLAAVFVTALAAWTDLRSGTIPNALTVGVLVLAPAAHVVYAWTALGMSGVESLQEGGFSLLGAAVCGAVPAFLHRGWGAIGGGDVKLFAAIGALCHTMLGVEVQTLGFFVAALVAPAYRPAREALRDAQERDRAAEQSLGLRGGRGRAGMTAWFRLGPAVLRDRPRRSSTGEPLIMNTHRWPSATTTSPARRAREVQALAILSSSAGIVPSRSTRRSTRHGSGQRGSSCS